MWRRLSAYVEEAICLCGGGYLLNMNAVVALAQAEFWLSWVLSWGQAN